MIKKINKILKSAPFNLKEEINENSEIKELPGWDSLKHLMFLVEIEKKFKIEMSPEEISLIIFVKDLIKKIKNGN